MKRELKFRAWEDYGEGHRMMLHDRGDLAEFFDATVGDPIMQYTGLKDKNGKEIYEGDILKTDGVPNVHVYWFEQEARWNLQYVDKITQDISNILMKILNYYEPQQENGPGTDCQLNDTISYTSEIIGNIYENPELL